MFCDRRDSLGAAPAEPRAQERVRAHFHLVQSPAAVGKKNASRSFFLLVVQCFIFLLLLLFRTRASAHAFLCFAFLIFLKIFSAFIY